MHRRQTESLPTATFLLALAILASGASVSVAQMLTPGFADDFEITSFGSVGANGGVLAFAPGQNDKLYVGTQTAGVLVFDYDPVSGLSSGVRAVPQADSSVNGADGALGVAFHQDAVHGLVMYYAPNTFGASVSDELSLRRANDSNGDGVFGGPGDTLNQTIIDNLRARGEGAHRLNNMAVVGDTLFLNIGSRTQNGGVDTDARFEAGQARGGLQAGGGYSSGGETSAFGEYAYTGAVNFIEDLNQIGAGLNAAGFAIPSTEEGHALATEPFTSLDPGKLRVYATGMRNVFGMAVDDEGTLFVSENQNEWPDRFVPDRILEVDSFKDDFGYQKSNGFIDGSRTKPDFTQPAAPLAGFTGANGTAYYSTLGTYRDPAGSLTALAAANAGYFGNTAQLDTSGDGQIDLAEQQAVAFALVDPTFANPAVTGMAFLPGDTPRTDLAGDLVVGKFVHGALSRVDHETGAVEDFVTGFNQPLDVARDPFGNLLALSAGGALIQIGLPVAVGDYNRDGVVDAADYTVWRDTVGQFGQGQPADGNEDGIVDDRDRIVWVEAYIAANSGSAAVPEPAHAALFIGPALLAHRRNG